MAFKNFTLIREEHLSEVNGMVRLFEHNKTKAQIMSVCNDDENKSFGVTFRTPPKNSTGVAHILEHSVLCGSEKYPVKEPFVELLKSSLQTFLNAMTFPDKTTYPVASTNLQDFYNLIDVYLDAVFFPRIDENVLAQEGWHIHAEEADQSKWHFKGVVYNEMKGVYSSPDSVLAEKTQQSVFPGNLYSLDSGGSPENILDLTYEEFKDFHSRYYHPSNARIFFWGDDPEEARLEKIDAVLSSFNAIELSSSIALQKIIPYERKMEYTYAFQAPETFAMPEEDLDTEAEENLLEDEISQEFMSQNQAKNAHVTVSWLLCEGKDAEEIMVLEMLECILSALAGSPLRKALMDSGLGEDVTGCGLETDLRQAYFSIGLRSIMPHDGDKVELLIMDTLAGIVEEGIEDKTIQSALSIVEFALRENNTGSFPRGLSAMIQALSTWLYDEDPFVALAWEKPLANIKARLLSGEKVFENAIQKWFLNNTHRVCVVLLPDEKLAKEQEEAERQRLESLINKMSADEKAKTMEISKELVLAQAREDSQEALATIPTLTLCDIPTEGKENPLDIMQGNNPQDTTILHHEVDSTGILYTRILLPLDTLSKEELPYLSLYCRALTEMGTQKRDFVDLGLEISSKTGGFDVSSMVTTLIDEDNPKIYLQIFAKVVEEKIPALYDLMQEILTLPDFSVQDRFAQMVGEDKARFEQSMIPAGHNLVVSYLSGMLSKSGFLNEAMGGIPYWDFVRNLSENMNVQGDIIFPSISEKLTQMHRKIMCKNGAVLSLTGSEHLLLKGKCFEKLISQLPQSSTSSMEHLFHLEKKSTALLVPAQVNYVGLGGNIKETGYTFKGSSHVITRFLRMGYLWDRVRVQGGAYGCFVRYARSTGNFLFASYRDPNVERSLEVYAKSAEYLGNLHLTQEELTRSIVGAIGDIDTYHLPSAKGKTALWEYMSGYTKEMRAKTREEILATKLSDFHDFAPYLQALVDKAVPVALGGPLVAEYAQDKKWNLINMI